MACARQVVPGRARLFLLFRFISEESVELCGRPRHPPTGSLPWLLPDYRLSCSVLILTHSMLESRHFLVTHAGKHLKHQSHEQLEEVG